MQAAKNGKVCVFVWLQTAEKHCIHTRPVVCILAIQNRSRQEQGQTPCTYALCCDFTWISILGRYCSTRLFQTLQYQLLLASILEWQRFNRTWVSLLKLTHRAKYDIIWLTATTVKAMEACCYSHPIFKKKNTSVSYLYSKLLKCETSYDMLIVL